MSSVVVTIICRRARSEFCHTHHSEYHRKNIGGPNRGLLDMASAVARAYSWGYGSFAPSGVQGQCPWSVNQGTKSPLKLNAT